MDRSFLSQPDVIAASRNFVCVRLTTYESEMEAAFLKTVFTGRSGDVENTVFTILSPDGQRQLVRAARSARHSLGDATHLADTMKRISRQFTARMEDAHLELPKVATVRLAINVAACDHQPLAALIAKDAETLRSLEDRIQKLAWSENFLGRFIYTTTTDAEDLNAITGVDPGDGLIVVQPDRYGLKGSVLAHAPGDASLAELARTLEHGAEQHQADETPHRQRVHEGHRNGIFWETHIPVTDPLEQQAREHGLGWHPPR